MEIKKMNESTFYCSNMRTQGCQRKKAHGSDEHNLRLESDNPNYDLDLTKNNIYLIEQNKSNEIITLKSTSEIRKNIQKNAMQIEKNDMKIFLNSCNNYSELSQNKKNILVKQRSDLKRKFKKWIDNEKTTEEEKEIFEKCLKNLNDKKKYNDNFIVDFEKIDKKISRRNDKIKAIKKIKDFDKIADLKNRNVNKKIISNEIVFKIPDKNEVNVKPEHWEKMIKHFKNKYFKDYQMIYTAIHCDENPDNTHPHMKISGLNRKSKTFDIPDHEIRILRKHTENYEIEHKKWCEYTDEECKKHGELYQDFLFNQMNIYLSKLGYDINVKKRTEEQKIKDNHTYQKTLRSTKRGHNRQNKLNEENQKLKKQKTELENKNIENKKLNEETQKEIKKNQKENEKLEKNNQKLKINSFDLININNEMKNQHNFLNRNFKKITNIDSYVDELFA